MNIIYFIHELNDIFILSLGYIFTLIATFLYTLKYTTFNLLVLGVSISEDRRCMTYTNDVK